MRLCGRRVTWQCQSRDVQINDKSTLNLTGLGHLLFDMEHAGPMHQTCWRIHLLVKQRSRMAGSTPIHRKKCPGSGFSESSSAIKNWLISHEVLDQGKLLISILGTQQCPILTQTPAQKAACKQPIDWLRAGLSRYWGSKPEPPKIPSPQIQPDQEFVQVDHLGVAVENAI